jgi:diguanylate cyclase (GGDEF)-like protein
MDTQELRTLLAEDDEEDYLITRDLLSEIRRMKFRLEWVPTYEAAKEAIERNQHDLYLLDYRLGRRDGLQLLGEALAHGNRAPVIFLTGLDDWETDFKVMKAGAADYLVKGQFDSKQLERSIRHAFERRRAEEQKVESVAEGAARLAQEQVERAEALAQTDALTGLGNRRKLEQIIQGWIGSTLPFSVLVFDMNGFKLVNDQYGHNQGDQLLKLVGQRLRESVRDTDVACRWGGDEFVVILQNTSLADAEKRAEQIQRQVFGDFSLSVGSKVVQVHASAGVGQAEYRPGETFAEFFERADQLLLAQKRHGRSRRGERMSISSELVRDGMRSPSDVLH